MHKFRMVLIGIMGCVFLAVPLASADIKLTVMQGQAHLQKLGYYGSAIDGILGAKTQKAIIQFQIDMDLQPSGRLDKATKKLLTRPSMVLNTQDFAPFHYKTSQLDGIGGPIPQIIKLTCKKAGINCRSVLYDDWKMAQEDVKIGKADGLFVIAWNSQREKWLHRSRAIIQTEYGLFVHQDNPLELKGVPRQPTLLEGYTIGVYGPSGTSASLDKFETAMVANGARLFIEMLPDDKPLFEKLASASSEEKYAIYSNRIVGETIIGGMNIGNLRYAGKHKNLSYHVGFSKDRVTPASVEKFNRAHSALEEDGTILSLLANYRMLFINTMQYHPQSQWPLTKKTDQKRSVRLTKKDIHGATVVVDVDNCLMWQQSGSDVYIEWPEALNYVEKLNAAGHAGFSDWRIPKINELSTLLKKNLQKKNRMYISPLFDNLQQMCWSSETSKQGIQFIDYYEGATGTKDRKDTNFVRAVRNHSNHSNAECGLASKKGIVN